MSGHGAGFKKGLALIHKFYIFAAALLLIFCTSGVVEGRILNGTLTPGAVYTVCTSPFDPYVACTVGLTPSDASGYSIEVFKRAAQQVGLQPVQYTFACMNYTPMVNDLTDPNGNCDITAGDVGFTKARQTRGIKFVYPGDYRTGLVVMVHATVKHGGQWLFLQPFKWEVWVLLLVAALAVGVSVHLVELVSKPHMSREVEAQMRFNGVGGFVDSLWSAIAQVAGAGDAPRGVALPSRLIIFMWCFMILLLLTMYTGNAAAILTTTSISTDITSASDLKGRNWGAYEGSVDILANYGLVPARQFPWDNQVEQQAMLDALRNDEVDALILECAFVDWVTSYTCDLFKIGECFAPVDRGITFWQNASDVTVAQFGRALLSLEEAGDIDRLRQVFISQSNSVCGSQLNSGTNAVGFMQVSGLWIILAVTIAVAFLGALVTRHVNKQKYLARLVAGRPSLTRRGSVARSARAAAAAAVLQHENELYAAEKAGKGVANSETHGVHDVPAGSEGSPV